MSDYQSNGADDFVCLCARHTCGFGDFSALVTSIVSGYQRSTHFWTLTLLSGGQGNSTVQMTIFPRVPGTHGWF